MKTDYEQFVDAIVAQVLSQLRAGAPAVPTRVVQSLSPTPHACSSLTIQDKVVTADVLMERLAGKAVQQLAICPKSIVTPAARDWLKAKQIDWRREATSSNRPQAESASRCKAVVLTSTPAVLQAVANVKRLAGAQWSHELAGSVDEAVSAAASAVYRGEVLGVTVFADQAELVTCSACRRDKLNAAVVHDTESIDELATTMRLNVMVVKPSGRGVFELQHLLKQFAAACSHSTT